MNVEIRSKDPHSVSKNKKFRRQAQVKSQVSIIIHWRCATPTTSPESNATTNPSPEGGTDPKSGKAVVIMEEPSHHYGVGVPPHQINTPHVAMWIILQMEKSILLQPMRVLSVESWKIYFKGHQVYTEFSIHYIGEARNDKQPLIIIYGKHDSCKLKCIHCSWSSKYQNGPYKLERGNYNSSRHISPASSYTDSHLQ